MRPQKRSVLIKPSLLPETISHTAVGIAVGLAFAFLATHITALGIATSINDSQCVDRFRVRWASDCNWLGWLQTAMDQAPENRARTL